MQNEKLKKPFCWKFDFNRTGQVLDRSI